MTTSRKSVLVEISEDAYKQNSVYRPWEEIKIDGSSDGFHKAVSQPQSPKVLTITEPLLPDQAERAQHPRPTR